MPPFSMQSYITALESQLQQVKAAPQEGPDAAATGGLAVS
jgi:hypothetical protein